MTGVCSYERVVARVRSSPGAVPGGLPRSFKFVLDCLADAYPSRNAAWQAIAKAIDDLEDLRGTADPSAVEPAFAGWCRVIIDVVKSPSSAFTSGLSGRSVLHSSPPDHHDAANGCLAVGQGARTTPRSRT